MDIKNGCIPIIKDENYIRVDNLSFEDFLALFDIQMEKLFRNDPFLKEHNKKRGKEG